MSVTAAAERLLARERRADPFGDRLPDQLQDLSADVRESLIEQATLALRAVDVAAAAAALYARTRRVAFGSLPTWETLPRDTRDWWLSRAALARDERAPLPQIAPIRLPAAAAAAAPALF